MTRRQWRMLFAPALALLLLLGLMLVFQSNVSHAADTTQDDGQTYVVRAGDSLYKISSQFYGDPLQWTTIMEATNAKAAQDKSFSVITNPARLRIGQKLWLPK